MKTGNAFNELTAASIAEALAEIRRLADDPEKRLAIKPTKAIFIGPAPIGWRKLMVSEN